MTKYSFILISIFLFSCKKDETVTPVTTNETSLTNTIIGKAWYADYINKKYRNSFIYRQKKMMNNELENSGVEFRFELYHFKNRGIYKLILIPIAGKRVNGCF